MDIRKGNDNQIALLEDPVIQRLSQKYGKTPAQVRENHFLCILKKISTVFSRCIESKDQRKVGLICFEHILLIYK